MNHGEFNDSNSEVILRHHIKELEDKLKESEGNLLRQKKITERVVNNYEHLDQEYDKIYALLTEDQKRYLVNRISS